MIKTVIPLLKAKAIQYDSTNHEEVFKFVKEFYDKHHPYAEVYHFHYRISENSNNLILEYLNENNIRIIPDCSVIIKPYSWIVIKDQNGLNGMIFLSNEEFNDTYRIVE